MTPRKAAGGKPARAPIGGRRHYTVDGNKLLSVTSILELAVAKPALQRWAANMVAAEAVSNLPKLLHMARGRKDEAVQWLAGTPYEESRRAADRGTAAHDVAEAHVLGKPHPVPDPDTDAGRTQAQFLRFIEQWSPEFEATEATVANVEYGYAGTLDAIVRIPAVADHLLVLDYKTGKTGPYPEWAMQVAAYGNAESVWLRDGARVPMPEVGGGAVLRLRPDFYELHVMEGGAYRQAWDTFLSAARVARFLLDAEKSDPWSIALPTPALEMTS